MAIPTKDGETLARPVSLLQETGGTMRKLPNLACYDISLLQTGGREGVAF